MGFSIPVSSLETLLKASGEVVQSLETVPTPAGTPVLWDAVETVTPYAASVGAFVLFAGVLGMLVVPEFRDGLGPSTWVQWLVTFSVVGSGILWTEYVGVAFVTLESWNAQLHPGTWLVTQYTVDSVSGILLGNVLIVPAVLVLGVAGTARVLLLTFFAGSAPLLALLWLTYIPQVQQAVKLLVATFVAVLVITVPGQITLHVGTELYMMGVAGTLAIPVVYFVALTSGVGLLSLFRYAREHVEARL